jgi:hypothetical protein
MIWVRPVRVFYCHLLILFLSFDVVLSDYFIIFLGFYLVYITSLQLARTRHIFILMKNYGIYIYIYIYIYAME